MIGLLPCRIFRPHCQQALHSMQPVAADVACSMVCVTVCLCWSHVCAVQKRLKQLVADSFGSEEQCSKWRSR